MSARPWRKRRNMTPRRIRKMRHLYIRAGESSYLLELLRQHTIPKWVRTRKMATFDFGEPSPALEMLRRFREEEAQ